MKIKSVLFGSTWLRRSSCAISNLFRFCCQKRIGGMVWLLSSFMRKDWGRCYQWLGGFQSGCSVWGAGCFGLGSSRRPIGGSVLVAFLQLACCEVPVEDVGDGDSGQLTSIPLRLRTWDEAVGRVIHFHRVGVRSRPGRLCSPISMWLGHRFRGSICKQHLVSVSGSA